MNNDWKRNCAVLNGNLNRCMFCDTAPEGNKCMQDPDVRKKIMAANREALASGKVPDHSKDFVYFASAPIDLKAFHVSFPKAGYTMLAENEDDAVHIAELDCKAYGYASSQEPLDAYAAAELGFVKFPNRVLDLEYMLDQEMRKNCELRQEVKKHKKIADALAIRCNAYEDELDKLRKEIETAEGGER